MAEREVLTGAALQARIERSFARQTLMGTLGATLDHVSAGHVVIRLPYRADVTQQHGFLHAGVVSAVVDSACGYAALTTMDADAAVVSVEFKVNLLAPAKGQEFFAHGRVVRTGRTITVCSGECRVGRDGPVVAVMQSTMMAVRGREGMVD